MIMSTMTDYRDLDRTNYSSNFISAVQINELLNKTADVKKSKNDILLKYFEKSSHHAESGRVKILKDIRTAYISSQTSRLVREQHMNFIEQYFKSLSNDHSLIRADERYVGGKPSIQGTRIPVSLILACLRDDMTKSEIKEDYGVDEQQINAAIDYAVDALDKPYHNLP